MGCEVSSSADGLTPLNLAVSEVNSQGMSVHVWEMLSLPPFYDFSGTGNATPFPDSCGCLLPSALPAEVPLSPSPGECGGQYPEMAQGPNYGWTHE